MKYLELPRRLFERGQYGEAIKLLNRRQEDYPLEPDALLLLGVCLARDRKVAEAKAIFLQLVSGDPNHFEALTWLALLSKNQTDISDALTFARRAIEVHPEDAAGYGTLGGCYLYLREAGPAIDAFRCAVERDPSVAEHHHNLGLAHQMAGRHREAIAEFKKAIELAPDAAQTYLVLAAQYSLFGIAGGALETLQTGLVHLPNSAALHTAIANAYTMVRNEDAAEHHHRRAMALSPDARGGFASWLIAQGRFEESEEIFSSLKADPRQRTFAYYGLMQSRKADSEFVREMETEANQALPPISELYVNYALGKAKDQLKDYEGSMAHYDRANRVAFQIHNAGFPIDPDQLRKEMKRVTAAFESMPPGSSSLAPIFIIGMIRSGTTLLEQIVSSHSQVAAAGELRFWIEEGARLAANPSGTGLDALAKEYAEYTELIAGKSERITDKMPLNFAYAGLILRALPNAKFIHIRRNPIDTCLSIYTTYFAKGPQYAYSKANIVNYYRQYLEAMSYWRTQLPTESLLEIDYEDLISDPSSAVPRVITFCDLPWEEACLHHEKNEAAINTPSRWQARQPIYATSMERWRKFEPWLGEFAELKP